MNPASAASLRQFFDRWVALPDAAWQRLEQVGCPARYVRKQLILAPEQVCDRMLFLHTGAMRTYLIKDGIDFTYFFFFPDTLPFATDFASFQTERPSQYYIECIDDCTATVFRRADIYALYETFPVMQKFGRLMAEQAYLLMDRRMNHFQFHDLETRYLALLREEPGLLQRVPQHLIATYLGVTPESLSRVKQHIARQKK